MTQTDRPDAFLLAGGRSTRMGRDKALLPIDGRTLLDAVADAVRPVARRVFVVGRATDAGGLPTVADSRPGLGPLAGIESALAAAETASVLVLACDLPLVSTALLELLVAVAAESPGAIVIPEDADGRLSPLCGVYPRDALAAVSACLDAGERRPRALAARVETRVIPFSGYAHLPDARRLLANVNTPGEYDAVRDPL